MIQTDIEQGLIPFWCGATSGSTSLGVTDPLDEISKICKKYQIWLNVDAAWAGSSYIVPEYRELYAKGIEDADSICLNFSKWMMCGMGSAFFYVADKKFYTGSLGGENENPEYLKNKFTDEHDVIDYKNWQVGLGRRFSSLKIWFLIRNFGVEGL